MREHHRRACMHRIRYYRTVILLFYYYILLDVRILLETHPKIELLFRDEKHTDSKRPNDPAQLRFKAKVGAVGAKRGFTNLFPLFFDTSLIHDGEFPATASRGPACPRGCRCLLVFHFKNIK